MRCKIKPNQSSIKQAKPGNETKEGKKTKQRNEKNNRHRTWSGAVTHLTEQCEKQGKKQRRNLQTNDWASMHWCLFKNHTCPHFDDKNQRLYIIFHFIFFFLLLFVSVALHGGFRSYFYRLQAVCVLFFYAQCIHEMCKFCQDNRAWQNVFIICFQYDN